MVNTKFDWDLIRRDYVQGRWITDPTTGIRRIVYPNWEDLCRDYGCAISTLKDKAYNEKPTWYKQRQAFRAKLNEIEDGRRVSAFVDESSQLDAWCVDLVKKQYGLISHYLSRYDWITDPDNNPEPEEGEANRELRIQDLKAITDMLDKLQVIGRRAVGEPVSAATADFMEKVRKEGKTQGTPESRKQTIEKLSKKRSTRNSQKELLQQKKAQLKAKVQELVTV